MKWTWDENEMKTKDQQRYKLENTVAQTWSSDSTRQLLIKFSLRSAPRLEYLWDSPTGRDVREAQLSDAISLNEYITSINLNMLRSKRGNGERLVFRFFRRFLWSMTGIVPASLVSAWLNYAQLLDLIWSCSEWSLQCLSMCAGTTDPRGIQLKKSRGFGSWRVSRLAKRFQSRLGCSNYDAATNLNERHLSKVCFVKTANFKKVSTLSILSSIISYI